MLTLNTQKASVCPDCGQPMHHAEGEPPSDVCDACFVEEFAGGDVAYAQELCGHALVVGGQG